MILQGEFHYLNAECVKQHPCAKDKHHNWIGVEEDAGHPPRQEKHDEECVVLAILAVMLAPHDGLVRRGTGPMTEKGSIK